MAPGGIFVLRPLFQLEHLGRQQIAQPDIGDGHENGLALSRRRLGRRVLRRPQLDEANHRHQPATDGQQK